MQKGASPKHPRLENFSPGAIHTILSGIRAGSFPTVAAGAVGIPRRTFGYWMDVAVNGRPVRKGPKIVARVFDKKWEAYRDFHDAVYQAQDVARLAAEVEVRKMNPLAWLRLGPGRDNGPGDPGWTERLEIAASDGVASGLIPIEALRALQARALLEPNAISKEKEESA